MKCCADCGQSLSMDHFWRNKQARDGLQARCKACQGARNRRWATQNPERKAALGQRWWRENGQVVYERRKPQQQAYMLRYSVEHAETLKAKSRMWRARNRKRHQAYTRAWRVQHPAQYQARNLAWRLANPEKFSIARRAAKSRRRARMKAAVTERIDWNAIYARDRGICQWCRKPVVREKMSLDHIWPISRGGSHTYQNVQLVHLRCNQRKNAYGHGQLRLIG